MSFFRPTFKSCFSPFSSLLKSFVWGHTLALKKCWQDLPFKKGAILTIKNTSVDPNWWVASDKDGKEGMVPANYVVCT